MVRKNIKREIEIAAGQNIKEYEYWRAKLSGELVKSSFPFDFKKSGSKRAETEVKTFHFKDELYARLVKLSKGSAYTLHIVLLAVLTILLGKYTGNKDILLGTPIYRQETWDELINTLLVLRNKLRNSMTFRELLMQVKRTVLEAVEHQAYPVMLLPEKLDIPVSEPGFEDDFPLFDIVLLLQNIHEKKDIRGIKPNIIFSFYNGKSVVEGEVEYNSSRYLGSTIERIVNHFTQLLRKALEDPGLKVYDIEILSDEEKKQILFDFNDTYAEYPKNKTIQQLFEEQVVETPDKNAVVGPGRIRYLGDVSITYRRLNEESNRLARLLREKGVRPDTMVGIMVHRSIEMIVGILAILKAGGAYLPIEPDYPSDRIKFMLKDSGARQILTTGEYGGEIGEKAVYIEQDAIYREDVTNLTNVNNVVDLAYIIYTSGTTGKPKGVMIEHRNVVRLMFNDKYLFDFNDRDVWTMFHSYCFDFSVWEMYGALLYGGQLVVISRMEARDFRRYLEILKEKRVTILNQTPSAFYNLLKLELEEAGRELNIRYIIFGGEALNPVRLKGWRAKYPETKLINMYGITETTVHVTFKEIGDREIESNISNIGKAIPTLYTYIADRNLKLVPVGSVGELVVGGDGVGRGYLNRPGISREKFISDPYRDGGSLYRSGDLVSLSESGEMEYQGRIDHQVKIRGFRIELGEIENLLLNKRGVKDAVVTAWEKEPGKKSLCAYIVSEEEIKVPEIREYLSRELPDYMIPAYFMQLEKFPLTSNGKLARKRLPAPKVDIGSDYVAPESDNEKVVAGIWKDVLGLDKVGIHNNFFDLGGSSFDFIEVNNRLKEVLNRDFPLVLMFRYPTISTFGQYLDQEKYSLVIDRSTEKKLGSSRLEQMRNMKRKGTAR